MAKRWIRRLDICKPQPSARRKSVAKRPLAVLCPSDARCKFAHALFRFILRAHVLSVPRFGHPSARHGYVRAPLLAVRWAGVMGTPGATSSRAVVLGAYRELLRLIRGLPASERPGALSRAREG